MKLMFNLLALFALLVGVTLVRADAPAAAAKSSYVDVTYGFSLNPPDFGASKTRIVPVTFIGPEKKGFSDNVNVLVQPMKTTRKDWLATTSREFEQVGAKMNSTKELQVSGHDAVILDYEASMNQRKLHFLALAVFLPDRVYLLTGTVQADDFAALQPELQRTLESFRLTQK
jgi:hypothetical protein